MMLESIGIAEVDSVGLVCILGYIREMQAKGLTESAEFDLSLMLQAELKGLLGNLLSHIMSMIRL